MAFSFPWSLVTYKLLGTGIEGLTEPPAVEDLIELFVGGSPGLRASGPGGLGGHAVSRRLPQNDVVGFELAVFGSPPLLACLMGALSPAVASVHVTSLRTGAEIQVAPIHDEVTDDKYLLIAALWPPEGVRCTARDSDGSILQEKGLLERWIVDHPKTKA
jgi:hypothetical protein